MKTVVLGSGGWGTALSLLLLDNGNDVVLWSAFSEEAAELREKRENKFLPNIPLPKELVITDDIFCASDADLVVLAAPSFAVRQTANKLASVILPGTTVVSVAKGIEDKTLLRLSQVIDQELRGDCPVVVLCGPSHAEEVARKIPTACVAASEYELAAELVQDVFMNPNFRVYSGNDMVGAELGAALKNVIALCCGICDGMGLGDNTKAMLMTRGLSEIARLGVALGGHKDTFAGLTGIGDLIVTCTSMHSRNRRAGILIGEGKSPAEAVKLVGSVVEGYYATSAAKVLAEKTGVEMPICEAAYGVLYENRNVREAIYSLMTRQKKRETEDTWL